MIIPLEHDTRDLLLKIRYSYCENGYLIFMWPSSCLGTESIAPCAPLSLSKSFMLLNVGVTVESPLYLF